MPYKPFTDIHAAVAAVASFYGSPEEFLLPIADTLQDSIGMCMALVTDRVLARGWEPNGYEQGVGFRLYRYKAMQ
jgi:hypothetical protein